MSATTKLAIKGLARDPNAFQAESAGELRRAENIVVRSEGVAESRPNFELLVEQATSYRIKSAYDYGGLGVTVEQDADAPDEWRIEINATPLAAPILDPTLIAPPNYDDCETKFAEARGNLYLTGLRGSLVVDGSSATASHLGGVDMRLRWAPWSGGFKAVRDGLRYAYVVVYVRKDRSGYIRRSPPSDRRVVDGVIASGGTFYIPTQLVAGDQVEFYRSLASATSSISPRPEHFLAFTYTLTSADIAAGNFNPPDDNTADADLGAELYTDAAQGGAIAAKYRAPLTSVLASWQRCMWYGRTRAASRIVLTMAALFRPGVPIYWSQTAWTFTGGSPTATAPSATGLYIGMSIADDDNLAGPSFAGTYIAANTTILNIVGTTITMSTNALTGGVKSVNGFTQSTAPDGLAAYGIVASGTIGTSSITTTYTTTVLRAGMYFISGAFSTTIINITGPTTFTLAANLPSTLVSAAAFVGDIVTINGISFYAGVGTNPFALADMTLGRAAIGATMQNLVVAIETYSLAHPTWSVNAQLIGDLYKDVGHPVTGRDANGMYTWPGTVGTSLLLEEGDGSGASFSTSIAVSCTAPKAFTPATPLTSENTVTPNRLYFSDVDEPESVPLANYFDVGLLNEPIQALVPLRDGLLIFKTDGLWRVTGSGPNAWRVDPIDSTIRLVRPETVAVVNGTAYAWVTRGFFAVSEGGAQSLSANAIDVELRDASRFVLNQPTSHGAFVVPWRGRNLVLLCVPDGDGASACALIYALSLTTGTWTEWPFAWGTACQSADGATVYYSRPADGTVEWELRQSIGEDPRGYDREWVGMTGFAFFDATYTVLTISAVNAGAWEPVVGDWLGYPGGTTLWRRITSASLSLGTWTLEIEAVWPGITVLELPLDVREGAPIVIEWHPAAPAGIPVGALCREIQVQLDLRGADQKDDVSLPSYVVGGKSERDTSAVTLTSSKARVPTIQPLRVGVSRQIARNANLAAYFGTNDISPIRVLGISLVFEGTSERTTR